MAIFAITVEAATLEPDMAPKTPQAKTVAIPSPPRTDDSNFAPALYRSSPRPLEDEKYAISINIGMVVSVKEATVLNSVVPRNPSTALKSRQRA